MNALVTALPGLVVIFVLAGGVNALVGVLFPFSGECGQYIKVTDVMYVCRLCTSNLNTAHKRNDRSRVI